MDRNKIYSINRGFPSFFASVYELGRYSLFFTFVATCEEGDGCMGRPWGRPVCDWAWGSVQDSGAGELLGQWGTVRRLLSLD